jgi:hypothetical protein
MQPDAAVWSLDLSLNHIRDCASLSSLMKSADTAERRWLGRQLANVLAALPAAQDELAAISAPHSKIGLRQLKELARQVAMLETVVLELAREHHVETPAPLSAS